MRLSQFFNESLIDLHCSIALDEEVEERYSGDKLLALYREMVFSRIADLLDQSGKIGNRNKLYNDLLNREKKASTAVGHGLAIPHVRTIQAKSMVMGFLRTDEELPWDTPDGQPLRFFVPIVGPPYDDKVYLRIYSQLGELFESDEAVTQLATVEEPGEVIRICGSMS